MRDFDDLLDIARRRELGPDERRRLQRCLEENPSLEESWTEEIRLIRLLQRLPEVPLRSDFTAWVVESATRQASLRPRRFALPLLRFPRPAYQWGVALLLLAAVGLTYFHYSQTTSRGHIASSLIDLSRGVEEASRATQIAGVEVLLDFESIQQLGYPTPLADEDLLAAFE
jgi:hypothetical protein